MGGEARLMPRFAANLTMLFTEVPFLDRFAAASQIGFKAVEFQFPYAFNKHAIAQAVKASGLRVVLHNLPAGDFAAGERGLACLPGREAEFRAGVSQAIEYAAVLGCPQLNCLAGVLPPGVDAAAARATLVENLRFAARALREAGLRLVMEPVNTRDMPGFFVPRTAAALDIIAEVGSANLLMQFDIYHAQVTDGDLARTLEAHFDKIGHIQIADNPGRHEPGTGGDQLPVPLRPHRRAGL